MRLVILTGASGDTNCMITPFSERSVMAIAVKTRNSLTVAIFVPSKRASGNRSRLSPVTRKSADPGDAVANR